MKNKLFYYLSLFLSIAIFSPYGLTSETLKNGEFQEQNKQPLTVWIRTYGEPVKNNRAVPYIKELHRALQEQENTRDHSMLIATDEKDEPVITQQIKQAFTEKEYAFLVAHSRLRILVSPNIRSFSATLNYLIKETEENSHVLTLSIGVGNKVNSQGNPEPGFSGFGHLILEGLGYFATGYPKINGKKREIWAYGWTIQSLGNKGTDPGKGWYNTAALLNSDFINFLKRNPVPKWVDNGELGEIRPRGKSIPLGGLEELPMMYQAIFNNKKPHPYFLLNTQRSLEMFEKLGTDLSYEEKRQRKSIVGHLYLLHLDVPFRKLWKHLYIGGNGTYKPLETDTYIRAAEE